MQVYWPVILRRSSLAWGLFFLGLLLFVPELSVAQQWTRFRGPNGAGLSSARTVPDNWTAEDYNWITELPGSGHSCPVVWGERLFVTSAADEGTRRMVICLDTRDGSRLWIREYPGTSHPKHVRNTFATPTPAVDEDYVFVAWSSPESYVLTALDHAGNEVWQYNLGTFESQHSCGTSPVIYQDLVILGNDQDGESYLLAVDRETGERRWQIPRTAEVVAYATPCIYKNAAGEDELIFNSGAHGMTSVHPLTGEVNWELDVLTQRAVSSPVLCGELLLATCGSGGGGNYVAAVRPGTSTREPEQVYVIDKSAPYVPTPVVRGGLLFLWSDNGVVTCAEAATGEPVWRKRIGGNYSASPIIVDNKLISVSDTGEVVILAAGPKFEELGRIELGEECRSTPAVAGGKLYLRTISHVFSIGG